MPRGLGRREGWRWREATVRLYVFVKRQSLPDTWCAKFACRDGFAKPEFADRTVANRASDFSADLRHAKVAELVDAPALGAGGAARGGSSPPFRTNGID